MGILLDILKNGELEMSLSEYSIKKIDFESDTEVTYEPKLNDITRDITISGVINTEKITEAARVLLDEFGEPILDEQGNEKTELREIDSVRKLINWAIIPEFEDCYKDMKVAITDARGVIVKKAEFSNLYVIDYEERFNDDMGHGEFVTRMREREKRLEGF